MKRHFLKRPQKKKHPTNNKAGSIYLGKTIPLYCFSTRLMNCTKALSLAVLELQVRKLLLTEQILVWFQEAFSCEGKDFFQLLCFVLYVHHLIPSVAFQYLRYLFSLTDSFSISSVYFSSVKI